MTPPDRREWFRRDGRDWAEVWYAEAKSVAIGWADDLGRSLLLRVTAVGDEWYCLDAWRSDGRSHVDQGEPPTEVDIPVGFV